MAGAGRRTDVLHYTESKTHNRLDENSASDFALNSYWWCLGYAPGEFFDVTLGDMDTGARTVFLGSLGHSSVHRPYCSNF